MKNFRELPTPCLILDLDRFEANVRLMGQFMADHGVGLRPHAKSHKCSQIARRQVKNGAIGISVATIAEAEFLTKAGLHNLLVTCELVGEPKIRRFTEVLKHSPEAMVVVDDPANADDLNDAALRAGLTIDVLIDLDVGQNRTGVKTASVALSLASSIARKSHLRLAGVCAYAGHVAHMPGFETRSRVSREAWSQALEICGLLRRDGHDIRIVTGASTGTYNIDSAVEGVTEIQAGSYVFMDVEYLRIHQDFAPALFVLGTVIHVSADKAIVDAGLKAFATDRAFGPELADFSEIRYEFAGDEHGRLILDAASTPLKTGDKLRFIPPHCDPNVNLYDRFYCVTGEDVVDEWSIMNRSGGYF